MSFCLTYYPFQNRIYKDVDQIKITYNPNDQTIEEFLEKYKNLDLTLIFYSAPHDIKKDIESIYKVFGDRKAVAVKEITKLYESAEHFNLANGLTKEPKGEYVLLVEGGKKENQNLALTEKEHIELYISQGFDKKEALKKAFGT